MGSYLTNPRESFIPTSIPSLNFDAISGLLNYKQNQYDQGFNQVKNIDNSILNANVTKTVNNNSKELYIKDAHNQLQNLSSVDLSLDSNVAKASGVFQPFFEDTDLQMDRIWTKQNQNEIQKGIKLRDSNDPKDRDQYFGQSVGVLQDAQDKVRSGAKGDMSVYQNKRYVPYKDPVKYLNDQAKSQKMDIVYTEGSNKPYLIKYENGQNTAPNYEQWAKSQLSTPEFNDIFKVMGEYDMNNQVKGYTKNINTATNQPYTEQEAKSAIASDYINKMVKSYSDSIVHNNEQSTKIQDSINDIMNRKYANGSTPNQEDLNKLKGFQDQIDNYQKNNDKSKEEINKWTKPDNTKDNKGSHYNQTFDDIVKFGDLFFGNQYSSRIISNWAYTYANTHSKVTVSENPVYKDQQKHEDRMLDINLRRSEFNAKIIGGYNKNNGGSGGSRLGIGKNGNPNFISDYDKDGIADQNEGAGGSNGKISASEHEQLYNRTPDSGHDTGYASTENLKIEHPAEAFMNRLTNDYTNAINVRYDALSKIIPYLGIKLGDNSLLDESSAIAFANESKDNYINPKSGASPNFNKVFNALKSQGYDVKEGSPSTVYEALRKLVTSKVVEFTEGKINLPQSAQDAISQLDNSDTLYKKWYNTSQEYSNQINSLINNDKNHTYDNIKIKDGDKYRFINTTDIKNDLTPLEGSIHETSNQPITSIHNFSTNNLSIKDLAQAYIDGKVKLNLEGPQFRGSKEGPIEVPQLNVDGKNYSVNFNQIAYLKSLKNKYGESSTIPTKLSGLNTIAATTLGNSIKTGEQGHSFDYDVSTDRSKPNYGSFLTDEVTNPDNRLSTDLPPSDGLDQFINGLSGNMDKIARIQTLPITNKGVPGVKLTFKGELFSSKNNKPLYQSYGLSESEAQTIQHNGSQLTIYLKPTAHGAAIDNMIMPKDNFIYGDVLAGLKLNSTPLQEASNMKFEVIPDNYQGGTAQGSKAKSCTMIIKTKTYNPKTNSYSDWIPYTKIGEDAGTEPDGGGGNGIYVVPLSGSNGKSIDDVRNWIGQIHKDIMSTNYNSVKQYQNANATTEMSPDVKSFMDQIKTIQKTKY